MDLEPRVSRPRMDGYGVPQKPEGMLSWKWARERLSRSHNYWLTTARPDGMPHAMPVWGVWLDGAWYCSTAATSRKARNLAENPRCVVCNENAEEAVILEGEARQLRASEIPRAVLAEYKGKYGLQLQGSVFEVRPRVVFAMPEKQFPASVTRWDFA
jgi:nitroimidazol reductase NimA-like FMN-containing flavoprotein (pyridoxamine 5'-phosphate oxidase superfamily)